MGTDRTKNTKRAKKKTAQPTTNPRPQTSAASSVPLPEASSKAAYGSPHAFPIVGMGASAGGLAAFEAFFSSMPPDSDPGMAFVLVQHLDPGHKSILADLIRRYTHMQVFEVEDGMAVRSNCVYIIPPNKDMAFLNGALQLLEPTAARGQRLPIDFLFRSLAADQRERAIGIVFSGTGSDGALGARAIKGEGGMVMAQSPSSSEFDGMPKSVIATGIVDFVLTPARMPAQLTAYAFQAFSKSAGIAATPRFENALKKIFISLRALSGHDFSLYKPNTIHRRIERRLAVLQIENIDDYVRYLQQSQAEVETLLGELLIGVTSFFRDPDSFKSLEALAIPELFNDKPAGAAIRVWVPGCSTGEEAYSIAMLISERMTALKQNFSIQVFATDIDSRAVGIARAGIYPASIAADVSTERLTRFFTPEPGGGAFRIRKDIRDLLVFSEQNMIKDPPFSKLDLISCRNVLIYMGSELQKRVIPLFHYALNPNGFLFLGTSESVGEFAELFGTLDRKAKLYRRKNYSGVMQHLRIGQVPAPIIELPPQQWANRKKPSPSKASLRELTEQALLENVAPAGALVNSLGDILYLHGRTGMFLEPAQGESGLSNILTMAREGLRRDLALALRKASRTLLPVRVPDVQVKTNGGFTHTTLGIRPVRIDSPAATSPLFLVTLEDAAQVERGPALAAAKKPRPAAQPRPDAKTRILALEHELRSNEEYMQATREELESSNEELKSANEEMQSVNEELQSTNEELETAKEEMQSVNEELSTVNAELQAKVTDLARANNDMNNLLAGTGIGTIFVDHRLLILRFTPAVAEIIKLIPSDIGRPVSDITSNLIGYDSIVADTRGVLDTLVSKELEVCCRAGRWFVMRIQPYRTIDNVIEGAVITFVEITMLVQSRESLRRLAVVVRDANDAITVQDLEGRTLAWNPGAQRMYGWTEDEALRLNVRDRIPAGSESDPTIAMGKLGNAEVLQPFSSQRKTRDGSVLDVQVTATALSNETGQIYAIATTERLDRGDRTMNVHNGDRR